MAKVKQPLHSLTASGDIAGVLRFKNTPQGAVVGKIRKPVKKETINQYAQKAEFSSTAAAWTSSDPSVKSYFDSLAVGTQLTGFQLFTQYTLDRMYPFILDFAILDMSYL